MADHHLGENFAALKRAAAEGEQAADLDRAIDTIIASLRSGGRIWICGNGGSDAHAGHLAAELRVRFAYDRPALDAEWITEQPIVGSAIDNDLGPDRLYARRIEGNDRTGDVVMWITTSGRAGHVCRGHAFLDEGVRLGAKGIALTGPGGIVPIDDYPCVARALVVRSTATGTPAIQEEHQAWVHEIARRVEEAMCPR